MTEPGRGCPQSEDPGPEAEKAGETSQSPSGPAEPKWLRDAIREMATETIGASGDPMVAYHEAVKVIQLCEAHIRELREALQDAANEGCCCHKDVICAYCGYRALLDRQEPPSLEKTP